MRLDQIEEKALERARDVARRAVAELGSYQEPESSEKQPVATGREPGDNLKGESDLTD